jgi:riboflavin synthase
MFTGLVEATGQVLEARQSGTNVRLAIALGLLAHGTRPGDSISVSGVCLTVAELERERAAFELVPETLRRTTLARVGAGARVNLERALKLGDRLGGHLVQGHVDGTAEVASLDRGSEEVVLRLRISPELRRGLIAKGSVAIDGVSLTVAALEREILTVALIPHTLSLTNLGDRRAGDRVNIELDLFGKWVREIVEPYLSGLPDLRRETNVQDRR